MSEKELTKNEQIYPFNIELEHHIEINNDFNYVIDFSDETPKEYIRLLIENMPSEYELFFYDPFHESRSDPGAYITVKWDGDFLKCQSANHGWSTRWESIDVDKLTDYIYKVRKYNNHEDESGWGVPFTIRTPMDAEKREKINSNYESIGKPNPYARRQLDVKSIGLVNLLLYGFIGGVALGFLVLFLFFDVSVEILGAFGLAGSLVSLVIYIIKRSD